MTGLLTTLMQNITNLFKWWVSVMPWETALRIRMGKHVTVLTPGLHLRVPLLHSVYKQSTRMRRSDMAVQTVTTADGKTVTIGATIGYSIGDIQKLYNTLHDANGTLGNLAQSAIAEYVRSHEAWQCAPGQVEAAVNEKLDFERFGLANAEVRITDFTLVRTYRLIQDARWSLGTDLDTLRDTSAP